MSPRRSSRARTSQPAPIQPHANTPTTNLSNRQDRIARPSQRQDSGTKSPSPHSSSEEADDINGRSTIESRQTRGNKKQREPLQEDPDMIIADVPDEEGDEEEVTRCICRRLEYPGPPVPLSEGNRNKDTQQANGLGLESLPDDAGSLFIQCDICKVWQHGGCVGIMDEETTPENYFCEECRSDLHKIMTGARGQRYSKYLPLYESVDVKSPQKHSTPKDSENRSSKDPEGKNGGTNANSLSAKRRSTMNSRAAWQEEEELQRVLEASKTEGGGSGSSNGHRKGKRTRDESEETKQDLKRRKTGSSGSDSPPTMNTASLEGDSDNEGGKGRNCLSKKARARAAEGHRERELRDKEREREREKAEAAGRRKGRADRRHADESEPPENEKPLVIPGRAAGAAAKFAKPQTSSKPAPGTPPLTSTTLSHKKNGRPPARRGRVGRNQYTRDAVADVKADSPRANNWRDHEEVCTGGSDGHLLANGSKPSKPRHMNPNRTSMNDLRKRAAGIMEFISRTQLEMAAEQAPPVAAAAAAAAAAAPGPTNTTTLHAPPPKTGLARVGSDLMASKLSQQIDGTEDEDDRRKKKDRSSNGVDEAGFKSMNSLQMMDVLARELVIWQKEHGRY